MLNSVEIPNQEAAWYLLREPMSKSSSVIVYIPTMWPEERQKLKKTTKELDEMGIDDDSTDIWKENWFTKSEDEEILAEMKFIEIYTTNENLILQRRQEFEFNLDIQKTIEICGDLCPEDGIDDNNEPEENIIAEQNPFQHLSFGGSLSFDHHSHDWEAFKVRLTQFCVANGVTDENDKISGVGALFSLRRSPKTQCEWRQVW
ncbi:hypothetical protein EVAR_102065_1 [Eumeta japonica]|uniref:Uncharacterized protein n=1 Tax=Eumeta variegata TaxID=151549 RepID=A0A4C1TZU5_EUMVA|nr:hypothetical protein EVAR_102065_1 [Eumeta japonica]